MKKIMLASLALLFLTTLSVGQILNPVKWSFSDKKINDAEYDLIATARLDRGWYIYSQNIGNDGPIPTTFTFKPTPQYQLIGKAAEVSDHTKSGYDKIFDMNITKFSEEVKFIQRVKILAASADIKGSVEFQTCDDEKCLPPQEEAFSYNLSSGAGASRGAVTPPPTQPTAPTQTGVTAEVNSAPPPTLNPTLPTSSPSKPTVSGIESPVIWSFSSEKTDDPSIFTINLIAQIQKGWHIYANSLRYKADEIAPIPTDIIFDKNNVLETLGAVSEKSPKKIEKKEEAFDNIKVRYFEDEVIFSSRVKVKDVNIPVSGKVSFQACDAEKCLPPDEVTFAIDVKTGLAVNLSTAATMPQNPTPTEGGSFITNPKDFSIDKTNEATTCDTAPTRHEDYSNLWVIFLLGFGGGLLALLTPCVFPMIPLTVSFFIKGSKDRKTGLRNALTYAASIVIIYVSMGLLITAIFGSDALNRLSTDPWVNLAFGILFLVFAVSFFGYFEITLPSSWTNKADAASNRGGLLGIFFMAFTLALVSFSCTGPIIGSLLVQTATSTGISAGPAIGMLGFASALALPFGLFALFPTWLHSLPKSGGWMDDVKVTLGFIEIALAFKFLSNVDLIKGWKLLPYEAFLAVWILCAVGLALYHLGLIKIHGHSSDKKFTAWHKVVAALSVVFAVYLGTGYRYNTITETFDTPTLGSGILPPAGYSYIYPQKCPLNINCYHDFNKGLAEAKKVNKPILLDFTGWNCANCRKMEENVWTKPGVRDIIKEKYVLVSLYTDDKSALKAPYAPYVSSFDNKIKDTEGEMWTDFEATHFNRNSQPYYVLLSPDGKVLNTPVDFTPDADEYRAFLECGLNRFNSQTSVLSQLR